MTSYSYSSSTCRGKGSFVNASRHALIDLPPLKLLNASLAHDSPGPRKARGIRSQQWPPYFSHCASPTIFLRLGASPPIPLRLKESTILTFHCVVVLVT